MTDSQSPIRAVIDSNAVDGFAASPEQYEVLARAVADGTLVLLWTHINVDELAAITDAERRAKLLCVAASLCQFVLTGTAGFDYSRLNFARWAGDGPSALDAVRSTGNLRDTRDGIIAATAEYEKADLVTSDATLTKRASAHGIRVWTPSELAGELTTPS